MKGNRVTTNTVQAAAISITLDRNQAWAICNMLDAEMLKKNAHLLERDQVSFLKQLGCDIGLLIDHPSRDNMGEVTITTGQKPSGSQQ